MRAEAQLRVRRSPLPPATDLGWNPDGRLV
jgi:hypothetical protein